MWRSLSVKPIHDDTIEENSILWSGDYVLKYFVLLAYDEKVTKQILTRLRK